MNGEVVRPSADDGLRRMFRGHVSWMLAVPLVAALSWPTLVVLHGRWLDYGY